MLDMATPPRKRRGKAPPAPPPAPKRVRVGYSINVWVGAEHGAAFEELLRRTRRTKTAELELMIEKVCGEAGLWPPPKPGGE